MNESGNLQLTPPGAPVIKVSIRPAYGDDKMHGPDVEPQDVYALIDTGADSYYIDSQFAELNGYHCTGTASVAGATGILEGKIHPGLIKLTDLPRHGTFSAVFLAAPLRLTGRKYDLVLGMDFLSYCNLNIDFFTSSFSLTFNPKFEANG